MNYTTQNLSSVKDGLNAQSHEMTLSERDEYLEEMEKIWITLTPYQKEDLIRAGIRASHLNQAIAHLVAMPMEALRAKHLKENENVSD